MTLGGHIVDPEGGHISGPGDPERGHITWPLTFYVRISVEEFIVRLTQHIPDKGFRQIRYGGIFASRVRSNLIPIVKTLSLKI